MKLYEIIIKSTGYSLFKKMEKYDDCPINIQSININNDIKSNIDDGINMINIYTDTENTSNKFTNNILVPIIEKSQENKNLLTKTYKLVIRYIYIFLIFSLISWTIVWSIILTIQTNKSDYIVSYIFQIIFSLQYLIGVWYFDTDHLFKKLSMNTNMEKKFSFLILSSFIASIILSIVCTILTINGTEVEYYSISNELYKIMTPLLAVLVFFDKFFGYLSFLINSSAFIIIMADHKKEITNYTKRIKEFMISQVSTSEKVSTISIELLEMRERFNESVEQLNYFFSSLSILGIIDVFFVMKYLSIQKINSIEILNLIIFIIIEYSYIESAQKLRTSINSISNEIKLPIYMSNYLQKSLLNTKIPVININDEKVLLKVIFDNIIEIKINAVEIIEYQSFNQLQQIINEEWECFQIFGLKLSDTLIVQKIMGLIITIFIAGNIASVTSLN